MSTDMTRRLPPEERELERKRGELSVLQATLAERELDLASLGAALRSFERLYLRTVAVRYAELDELEAQIAEALAQRAVEDGAARARADQARERARETSQAAHEPRDTLNASEFRPTERLRRLYREVAKRVHPDLTTDSAAQPVRQRLMADLNAAYARGDEAAMERIGSALDMLPEAIQGEGAGAELVRTIRKIAQIEQRIETINAEIDQMNRSELARLKFRVEEASRLGRDLLSELAGALDSQIADAAARAAKARTGLHNSA